MKPQDKILLVDDDSNLLSSYKRTFRGRFSMDTAYGGESGLLKLEESGPYAVVVADRQMPRMDGIDFLRRAKQQAPDTVRIMLTGNADLGTAIRLVNESNIFRFLVKPCAPEVFTQALEDAVAQYRLVTGERELLNKTLSGSIKVLTDVLAMVDGRHFGGSQLMREAVLSVTEQLGLSNAWELHLAVMLSAIGQVTVPPETLVKAQTGQKLTGPEQEMLTRLPEVASRLLSNIPRLEGVARVLLYQHKNYDGSGFPADSASGEAIPLGARLLRILSDMMDGPKRGWTRTKTLERMQFINGRYDPVLLNAVRAWNSRVSVEISEPEIATAEVELNELVAGMVLRGNVQTEQGMVLAEAGQELTPTLLEKIHNFEKVARIKGPILIETPAKMCLAAA